MSLWRDLAAGVAWAYADSRPHASAVARQRAHRLVEVSGSVRCTVRSTRGSLAGVRQPAIG